MSRATTTPPTRTSWPARLGLVALGLSLLLLLDLLLRWLLPLPAPLAASGFAGSPPAFVEARQDDGSLAYVVHPARRHAFPPAQRFAVARPDDSALIFCLGGSSVYGYPYGAPYAFPRRLQDELAARHPARHFEVVNVGGMSYGSARLARLVQELVRYRPDVLVVYTGHNEFIEEDFFRAEQTLSPWRNALLNAARHLHVFRLLEVAWRRSPGQATAGAGAFGIDVARREGRLLSAEEKTAAASRFRHHLAMIADTARAHDVALILTTVPANLGSWQPEAGVLGPDLPAADLLDAATAWAEALQQEATEEPVAALTALETVRGIDAGHAEISYRSGHLLRTLGQMKAARQRFIEALEQDAAPIRALPVFNDAIRALATARRLPLVDIEADFTATSPDGIPGDDLFLDYCHPNHNGHQRIARALTPAVEAVLGLPSPPQPAWTEAPRHDEDSAAFGLWWTGNTALRQGYPVRAETFFRRALALAPGHDRPLVGLGQSLARQGRGDEALATFEAAVAAAADSVLAHNNLGTQLARMGRHDEALAAFEAALRLDPDATGIRNNIAAIHLARRQATAASTVLAEEMRRAPHLLGVHRNAGLAALLAGDSQAAATYFLAELRRNPADGRSAFHLARTYHARDEHGLARRAARLALVFDPNNDEMRLLAAAPATAE